SLMSWARERLPEFMVPASVTVVPAIPLTPHGKVDRVALAALRRDAEEERDGAPAPPHGPVETVLAGIWSEVLERESVSVRDDFFDLGAHSLLASRVLPRLRQAFGVELPL